MYSGKAFLAVRLSAASLVVPFLFVFFVFGKPDSTAADKQSVPMQVRCLILRHYGFNYNQITVLAGDLLLTVINDAAFNKDLDLYVEKDGQGRNGQDPTTKGRHAQWRSVLTLTPGIYWLREASHQKWVCKVTVLPPGQSH